MNLVVLSWETHLIKIHWKNKQYTELRELTCKLSGTIDSNRRLSWVTQKMFTVFNTCAASYAQACHCPSNTQGPESEPSCLALSSGRREVPGSLWELKDTHAEPVSLFILARLLKELLRWAKAEAFDFSLVSLLASGLQENASQP